MIEENITIDYKSIRKIRGSTADFKDLAKSCVCFANAQGGVLVIGIEDKKQQPPNEQVVEIKEINETANKLRMYCYNVFITHSEILTHENGGQYFKIIVAPSKKSIATTTDGKIFMRIGDECHGVRSEEIIRLAAEKEAYQWEIIVTKYTLEQADASEITKLYDIIQLSDKVSSFVKHKNKIELLEYFNLIFEDKLTHLGVLWIGTPLLRNRLSYPITLQYIVYDENGNKKRKETWLHGEYNPYQLILEIEKNTIELNYFIELPIGLFRKKIPLYAKEVIREYLINAFAHKNYTISSDILIEVYPNKLAITSPGGLPMGITPQNILHTRHRRNPHIINLFQALGLMEGEGSGYDLIYELNSRDSKAFPIIESDFNTTRVIQHAELISEEEFLLMDYILHHFNLTNKEIITLGIISRHKKILSPRLADELQLNTEQRLRDFVHGLMDKGIVQSRGIKKGTEYLINPILYNKANTNSKPSLKTIEPYILKILIQEDLKIHIKTTTQALHKRIPDVSIEDIRKALNSLIKEEVILSDGAKKGKCYFLAKKNKL